MVWVFILSVKSHNLIGSWNYVFIVNSLKCYNGSRHGFFFFGLLQTMIVIKCNKYCIGFVFKLLSISQNIRKLNINTHVYWNKLMRFQWKYYRVRQIPFWGLGALLVGMYVQYIFIWVTSLLWLFYLSLDQHVFIWNCPFHFHEKEH